MKSIKIVVNLSKSIFAVTLVLIGFNSSAVEEGEVLPDFALPSIYEGKAEITSASLEGKTIYLDFWASWCAPCIQSLPLYNEMYQKYKDQGLEVVAINLDNPIEDGLDFLLDTPLDFLIPSDPEGGSAELFEVIGMPTSYLIAPNGEVKLVHVGFRDGDMEIIEDEVQKILAEN